MRGIAILLVFLFHYGGGLRSHHPLVRALGYVTQAGWIGVDLFFALSGFLITGLLADILPSPPLLRNFYARRALRILPLYYAALLACAAAALFAHAGAAQLRPLLVYAFFLQNLPPLLSSALHAPSPLPIHHLWSLAVEEQFYLLWPLVLLAARTPRRALQLCLWTFALSCVFRAVIFAPRLFSDTTAQSFAVFLLTRAGALALGSALALYLRLPHNPRSNLSTGATRKGEARNGDDARYEGALPSTRILLALTALLMVLFLVPALQTHTLLLNNRPAFLVSLPAADLLSAALVALTLQANRLRQALSTSALIFLGRISYGFYVLHILLEPLFDRLGTMLTHATAGFPYQIARLLTAFLITLATAWLSSALLERPFLRLKRHFPRSV